MLPPVTPAKPEAPPDSRKVFLSYHSPDRAAILAIRNGLQAHGIRTFLDRDNLPLGLSWFEGLQQAIQQAYAVVVLLGPGELGVWQKREIALALDEQARLERTHRRLLVIPVLLPTAQPEQAPAFLMLNNGVLLTNGTPDAEALARLAQALGAETAETAEAPVPLPQSALCPYRGLDAFREEDAALFFGRDAFAENLLARVRQHPVVAVVGASGSGKSSVVQAGLLPRLRREGGLLPTWDAITCTPGAQPFYRLAIALLTILKPQADVADRLVLAGPLSKNLAQGVLASVVEEVIGLQKVDRLLLVVDQFEELFTLTPPNQRAAFIAALLQASRLPGLRLVFTLRADFYGAALNASRELSECLEQAQVNLGPARHDELRQMIEEPARQAGLRFETGLAELMLTQLIDQPGSLPLLEYALKGLWLKREGPLLTHAGYQAIGEIEGAINQQADAVFSSLSEAQQAACWRLFSRLVRVSAADEEGTDTRRRATLADLDAVAQEVARRFAAPDVRLLVLSVATTTGQQVVEVAHEALIRSWPRLRAWLRQEREFLLWRQEFEQDVAKWQQRDQHHGFLYNEAQLDEATQQTKAREHDLTPREREFLAASRAARQQRSGLIRWAVAAIVVVALGWGGWQWWLHGSAAGQIRLVENELVDLGNGKIDPNYQLLMVHHYLLKGQVPQMLAAAEKLPKGLKLTAWQLLLQDSVLLTEHKLPASTVAQVFELSKAVKSEYPEQADFRLAIARAYHAAHDTAHAQAALAMAREAATKITDDWVAQVDVLRNIAQAYDELHDAAHAGATLGQALATTNSNRDDPANQVYSLASIVHGYGKLHDTAPVRAALDQARKLTLDSLVYSNRINALTSIARSYWELHDTTSASATLALTRTMARKIDEPGTRADLLLDLAWVYGERHDTVQARATIGEAREAANEARDNPANQNSLFLNIAHSYAALHDVAAARAVMNQALAAVSSLIPNSELPVELLAETAHGYGETHNAAPAQAALAQALKMANAIRDAPVVQTRLLTHIAHGYGELHNAALAQAALAQAHKIAITNEDDLASQASDLIDIAQVYQQIQDTTHAKTALIEARQATQMSRWGIASKARNLTRIVVLLAQLKKRKDAIQAAHDIIDSYRPPALYLILEQHYRPGTRHLNAITTLLKI